jgi:transcriptional regulator with XRE-family HTH domain
MLGEWPQDCNSRVIPHATFVLIPYFKPQREMETPVSVSRDIYPNLKLRIYTVGIRQNRLAKMVGINEAYLSKIINGFREPSGTVRGLIADILNCDPDWLFQKFQVTTEAPPGIEQMQPLQD